LQVSRQSCMSVLGLLAWVQPCHWLCAEVPSEEQGSTVRVAATPDIVDIADHSLAQLVGMMAPGPARGALIDMAAHCIHAVEVHAAEVHAVEDSPYGAVWDP
jgi:hypothetical protein